MELTILLIMLALEYPHWILAALALGGCLLLLLHWDERRVKRRQGVVRRLDECPECGSGGIQREWVGAHWRVWCAECRTLSLAELDRTSDTRAADE